MGAAFQGTSIAVDQSEQKQTTPPAAWVEGNKKYIDIYWLVGYLYHRGMEEEYRVLYMMKNAMWIIWFEEAEVEKRKNDSPPR